MHDGRLIIFSAPSGAGKTTLVKELLMEEFGLEFSISACSRPPRSNELEGEDYYFMEVDEFKKKIEEGEFLEWEEVYENQFYGTLKSEIDRIWAKGKDVIFDVDVIGGLNIKKVYGEKALAIFVMPPNEDALKERLELRGSETEQSLKTRLDKARSEMELAEQFDEQVVNDDLQDAIDEAKALVFSFLSVD